VLLLIKMPHSEAHKRAVAKYVSTHMDMHRDISRRGVAKYYLNNKESVKIYNNRRHAWIREITSLRNMYDCMQ
jgi:hypothetical protein